MTTRHTNSPRITPRWATALAVALAAAGPPAIAQSPTGEFADPSPLRRLVQGEAELESVSEPFDTVIVGDAAIVATSVVNATTFVLTAKTTGRTNVILLDDTGAVQARWDVEVTARHRVAIYRGTDLSILTCNPLCGPGRQAEAAAPAP